MLCCSISNRLSLVNNTCNKRQVSSINKTVKLLFTNESNTLTSCMQHQHTPETRRPCTSSSAQPSPLHHLPLSAASRSCRVTAESTAPPPTHSHVHTSHTSHTFTRRCI